MTPKMHTRRSVAPDQPARNAIDWGNRWDVPKREEMIAGRSEQFPDSQFSNIKTRQDRLVGDVINACVVLHVYERLKHKASFEQLKFFFPGRHTPTEIDTLDNGPDNERLALLVKLAQDESVEKRLRTHRVVVPTDTWKAYPKAYTEWEGAIDKYAESAKREVLAKGHIEDLPQAPERPKDPRIVAMNKYLRSTIQIMSKGPKETVAIEANEQKKQVRDANRVCVMPVTPEYAKDFIKIMGMIYPPKVISEDGKELPRTFEEPAEIHGSGYFVQKLFLALDRKHTNTGVTPGNEATLAEIKIVPLATERAEELTDKLKPLIAKCFKTAEIKPDNFKVEYIKKRRLFTDELKKIKKEDPSYPFDYKFPAFPPEDKLRKRETFIHLGYDLMGLSMKIHEDAIRSENSEWQKEYVNTALYQKICCGDDLFKRDEEKLNPKDIQRIDNLLSSVLKRIAEANQWDLRAMEREIRQRHAEAKWKDAQDKKSRAQ